MKGPTPSQIKAAIAAATEAGAVRVRITSEGVTIDLKAAEPVTSGTQPFRFDHDEDTHEAA